jgi:DNA-binding beta-propeller fold protein YncE
MERDGARVRLRQKGVVEVKKRTLRIALPLLLFAVLVMAFGPLALAADNTGSLAPATDPSFHREFGVCYDQASGNVYLSDSLNNRIVKTKMDGSGWATLGTIGSGVGQFHDPRGIYYDGASGFIYVTDTGNNRVVKTKLDGSGWATLGTRGKGDGNFYLPRGIWYDAASELIYVPDTGNHRIVKTKIDGSGWATLGEEGRGAGQFLTPRGVQYDPASELLYVADTGNNRVVRCKWDASGWTTLGSYGNGAQKFREPRGIHYDTASGLLYVADHGNNRVVATKMDGSNWATYGSFGSGKGQFFFPRGVSLDAATSTVYVADTFNDRIVATRMDGSGWRSLGVRWRPYVWYFAEGTTRGEFTMFLTICNPGASDATVNVRYMMTDGSKQDQQVKVIAHSRYTINVKDEVGEGKDFSTRVWSDQPVIVERPMYFHFGKKWPGGNVVMGKPTLDTTFYFAEGTTREGFHTYLCMQNPNDAAASVTVTYMFDNTPPQDQAVTLDPHSRKTIDVNEAVGDGRDVSIVVNSDLPIVAERPMYFKYNGRITGGHVVIGATEPDTHFYLAEGTTRAGFAEYLCLLNPGETDANVTLRYMFTDGTKIEKNVVVGATSRHTVNVRDDVGDEKDVAVEIISDQPVVVERPMYFVYRGIIFGGHNVVATSDLGTNFYFAEGTTRPGFEEWICLFNPGDADAEVTITCMLSDGSTIPLTLTVGAHSRATVFINQIVPEGSDVSVGIQSSQPIVTERPIYFNFHGDTTGGSDAMGFNQ